MFKEPSRPDPDKLLAQIQAEEQAQKRGHLKIFLGYAAGVGKTYAMLEAAHQRKASERDQGIDARFTVVDKELVNGSACIQTAASSRCGHRRGS